MTTMTTNEKVHSYRPVTNGQNSNIHLSFNEKGPKTHTLKQKNIGQYGYQSKAFAEINFYKPFDVVV